MMYSCPSLWEATEELPEEEKKEIRAAHDHEMHEEYEREEKNRENEKIKVLTERIECLEGDLKAIQNKLMGVNEAPKSEKKDKDD